MKKIVLKIVLAITVTLTQVSAIEVSLEDKISSLYISFFNRAADEGGLTYWNNLGIAAQARGEDPLNVLKQLSAGFATHPTFGSTYDSMVNNAFVQAIYRNSLGRDGDAAGLVYWEGLLNNGKSRSDMVAEFMELSLTTDLTPENYPTLSVADLDAAKERQQLITNKVAVAVNFTNTLTALTNVVDDQNPENDPAYLASVEVLSGVGLDASTVSDAIGKILGLV
ncbi:MAG: DUF4214 domain-containing protein, partial [Sulfurimonas sp.]|nr:DUF4214 domain-containing protein [Sulfurimonas sp.]